MADELTPTQLAYVEWKTQPKEMRQPTAQADFAALHGISEDSLRRWQKTPWYREEIQRHFQRINVSPERIQQVMDAIHKEAAAGDVPAAKTYLAYVTDLMPNRSHLEERSVELMSDEELEQAWSEAFVQKT